MTSPPTGPASPGDGVVGPPPRAGLRERKKACTRASIRDHAMRLFEQKGYGATTVEQIAGAAGVSQSTFFRYFPTKEDVVLTDDYDLLIVTSIRTQPAGMHPVDAVCAAMHDVFGSLSTEERALERRRQRLFRQVPELQARMLQQTVETMRRFGEVIAERLGRPPGDVGAQVTAGAIVGAVLAVLPSGAGSSCEFQGLAGVNEALTLLREGL